MEENTVHPDYLKGFNEGYTLTQHLPDVAARLVQAKSDSERSKGFQDGSRQFTHEKSKDRLPTRDRSIGDRNALPKSWNREIEP